MLWRSAGSDLLGLLVHASFKWNIFRHCTASKLPKRNRLNEKDRRIANRAAKCYWASSGLNSLVFDWVSFEWFTSHAQYANSIMGLKFHLKCLHNNISAVFAKVKCLINIRAIDRLWEKANDSIDGRKSHAWNAQRIFRWQTLLRLAIRYWMLWRRQAAAGASLEHSILI